MSISLDDYYLKMAEMQGMTQTAQTVGNSAELTEEGEDFASVLERIGSGNSEDSMQTEQVSAATGSGSSGSAGSESSSSEEETRTEIVTAADGSVYKQTIKVSEDGTESIESILKLSDGKEGGFTMSPAAEALTGL